MQINEDNRKDDEVYRNKKYIDFDTIFTPEQRNELDNKFHDLKEVELNEKNLNVTSLLRTANNSSRCARSVTSHHECRVSDSIQEFIYIK